MYIYIYIYTHIYIKVYIHICIWVHHIYRYHINVYIYIYSYIGFSLTRDGNASRRRKAGRIPGAISVNVVTANARFDQQRNVRSSHSRVLTSRVFFFQDFIQAKELKTISNLCFFLS